MTRDFNVSSYRYQRLFTATLVKGAEQPFQKALDNCTIEPTDIPVFANNTAEPYPKDSAAVRSILGKQILEPVLFMDEIERLYDQDVRTFVEVGPKIGPHRTRSFDFERPKSPCHSHGRFQWKKLRYRDLARTLAFLTAWGIRFIWLHGKTPQPPKKARRMKMQILGANYRRPREQRPDPSI